MTDFIRRLNRGYFYLLRFDLKFGCLLGKLNLGKNKKCSLGVLKLGIKYAKLELSISKILPERLKNVYNLWYKYHFSNTYIH